MGEFSAFADSSWADDKNKRKNFMAYCLFLDNTICPWHTAPSQIIALSTAEAELMDLAIFCCEIVWARKLAIELSFSQLKPTNVYEDNTGCIALAKNTPLRGRSKHIALHVYFVQKPILDGILKVKHLMPHRSANCRHRDKACASRSF